MHLSTVYEWLTYIESIHATEIDLGLDRVKQVAERLQLLTPQCPVVIVGGTNGKGSTVCGLESIYRASGARTGAFTSPILFKHNEQVRINGEMASDDDFCDAFAKVEAARGEVLLTQFEFFTLAALYIFKQAAVDVLILEVGLGGRLDAVNILDADVAVVTSIGIDHVAWLGPTREHIGREKAGIFRSEHPAVCGDFDPPASLIETAVTLSTPLYLQGREFDFEEAETSWSWTNQEVSYQNLPKNMLAIQNMSVVLEVVTLLQPRLPVTRDAIERGLMAAKLPGRIQIKPGPVTEIYDVSHNPDAVKFLKTKLETLACTGKTHAVFSMLEDKDIIASLLAIKEKVDDWYVAPLQTKRGASMETLEKSFTSAEISNVVFYSVMPEAYAAAMKNAQPGDRVLVFGSFHTIAEVLSDLSSRKTSRLSQ